jgi:hypothetical protein
MAKARFTANRAIQKLSAIDPALATMVKDTYQWMIEFGAHPNPRSIVDHIRFKDRDPDGDHPTSLVYINSADSQAAIRALSACVENGCMVIGILCHTIPDHPAGSETFDRVWKLLKEFQDQLEAAGYWSPSESTP